MRHALKRSVRRFEYSDTPLPLFSNRRKDGDWSYVSSAINRTREHLGLQPDPVAAGCCKPGQAEPDYLLWSRIRLLLREPFLEFWGVFILVLFGDSACAQTYLSQKEYGSWINICFGWAAGIMFGIYVAGDSGAYLNPAVTLTNCIFRGVPLARFPIYLAAQLLGGLAAAAVVYAQYLPAIDYYEGPGIRTVPPVQTSSAKLFASFPADFVPTGSQFVAEFLGNFATTFCIFALRDENGADLKGGGGVFTMALFFLNFALISCFGWQTGSPINPGRDFSGRAFMSMVGYPNETWTTGNYFFWVPTFVPFIACIFGAWMYDVFIYTGPSPVNTPYLGLGQLWWNIRGKLRKKEKEKDEEEGPDEDVKKEEYEQTDGDAGKRKRNEDGEPESDRESECDVKVAESKGKDASWDAPKEDSNRHENAKHEEDVLSQYSSTTETSSAGGGEDARSEYEGEHNSKNRKRNNDNQDGEQEGEDLKEQITKDASWDVDPERHNRGGNHRDGEEVSEPNGSEGEQAETKKESEQWMQRNDSGHDTEDRNEKDRCKPA